MNFFDSKDPISCQCEFLYGGADKNGILCNINGVIQKDGNCPIGQWCVVNSTDNYNSRESVLCEKGDVFLILIMSKNTIVF